jgi:hypothetical protein
LPWDIRTLSLLTYVQVAMKHDRNPYFPRGRTHSRSTRNRDTSSSPRVRYKRADSTSKSFKEDSESIRIRLIDEALVNEGDMQDAASGERCISAERGSVRIRLVDTDKPKVSYQSETESRHISPRRRSSHREADGDSVRLHFSKGREQQPTIRYTAEPTVSYSPSTSYSSRHSLYSRSNRHSSRGRPRESCQTRASESAREYDSSRYRKSRFATLHLLYSKPL